MSTEPTTPRRSSRIIQTKLTVKPVRSFKRGYAWSWPKEPLARSEVDVSVEDAEDALDFYSGIYRNDPITAQSSTPSSKPAKGRSKGKGKAKASVEGEAFQIGDTVLVNTRRGSYPSVGVIVALWQPKPSDSSEEESDSEEDPRERAHGSWWSYVNTSSAPRIRVHWFVQPSELPKVRAHRDHAANEIYYSLASTAIISPQDILAHCSVSNDPMDATELEDTQTSNEHKFCCFYAIKAEKGVFYNFNWHFHREQALLSENGVLSRPKSWTVRPREEDVDEQNTSPGKKKTAQHSTKSMKRKREDNLSGEDSESSADASADEFEIADDTESEDENGGMDSDASVASQGIPTTPRKKRSRAGTSSPTKRHRIDDDARIFQTPSKPKQPGRAVVLSPTKPPGGIAPTPHSKAALRARQKLRTRRSSIGHKMSAPEFSITDAKALAHLPKDAHLRAMHVLHVGSRPDALPCREEEFSEVLEKILVLLEDGAGGCVYISGVPGTGKTATVHAVVRELHAMAKRNDINPFSYVEINGLRIPEPSAAYGVLWESISRHDVGSEGHLRISSKEALRKLDKHFSGSGNAGPGSHACIVLMDELDQLVTTKQDVVYNFFNWPTLANSKLIVLAVANTMDLPERTMTGKVRSRLGMERVDFRPYKRDQLEAIVHARLKTATENLSGDHVVMEPDAIRLAAARVAGVSGDARRVLDVCRRAVEVSQAKKRTGPVKAKDISEVMAEMQNSPTAAYIRDCSFHERIMLAAVWKCLKRTGVSVVKWDEIAYQHINLVTALAQDLDSQRRPSFTELLIVLDSLTATRAILIEDPRKGVPDGERKVMLNLEETEVLRVLGETGGPKWRSFLGI